jgi:excisionase family DNA binding protein
MIERLSYRIADAAKATGLSTRTIWRLISRGELRTVKVGGSTVIRADDLRAYLAVGSKNAAQS